MSQSSPFEVVASESEALDLNLLDSSIRIECSDPEFRRGLAQCFTPPTAARRTVDQFDLRVAVERASAASGHSSPARVSTVPSNALDPVGSARVRNPLDLCRALIQWSVLASSDHYVFHAGAVALEGRALLLPAGPRSGKSTTTAALLQARFDLLSDEVAPVDPETDEVSSFPRSLSLRTDVLATLGVDPAGGRAFEREDARMIRAAELGARHLDGSARLLMIAAPRYRSAAPTRLELLEPGQAVLMLMESSCSQARFKVSGLDWVIALVRRHPCYRITYSDARRAAEVLAEEFSRRIGMLA